MKQKKQKTNKKNLRRLEHCVVTAQTKWHLGYICAFNGWGEKDIGRAIDEVVKFYVSVKGKALRNNGKEW